MSDYVAPAKAAVELFLNAKFFADHFHRQEGSSWTSDPSSAGTSLQEDTVILTIQAGQTYQRLYKNFTAFNTVSYPYLVGRTTSVSGTYKVYIQREDTSAWIEVASGTDDERFVATLTDYLEGTIKGVRIECSGSPADACTFDYVVICESYVFPESSDITDELTVSNSLINDGEVNRASVTLTNFTSDSDTYTSITDFGYGIIWVSRSSDDLNSTSQKLFGGRISKIQQQYYTYGAAKVKIELVGHAAELFDSPENVYQFYSGEYGRTIIEDTLDLMNYLAKYPHAVGWFDYSGQVASVDDRISTSSVHSVEYDEVKPFTVIEEILNKSFDNSEIIGFDMYETPSGCLVGHKRNSTDWNCGVSAVLESAIKNIDFHRIINKQLVYGANGKVVPSDESWTEATTGWTTETGSLTAETTKYAFTPKNGTYFLWCEYSGGAAKFRRTISNNIYTFGKRAVTGLEFWRFRYDASLFGATLGRVELWAPDESNLFWYGLEMFAGDIDRKKFQISLGSNVTAEDSDDDSANKWQQVGSPDWSQITEICFQVTGDGDRNGIGIDDLKFTGMPYSNLDDVSEDATSQGDYGTREGQPIIDSTLESDAECKAKGDEIVSDKKDPLVTIEPFTVDGHQDYKPSYIMTDGVSNYRIITVNHKIVESDWKATITVSEA